MSKSNEKNEYSNQKIVASTLSKNKLKKISIRTDDFTKSENEQILENNIEFNKIRGFYDFKALNERYKDRSIYEFYLPSDETQSQYYELLNACRCRLMSCCCFVAPLLFAVPLPPPFRYRDL